MRTVLIAHRDVNFASSLAAQLGGAGYRTIICPGPWPPTMRCIRCDVGYCPLTEGTDVMIYDPDLMALHKDGREYNLAIDSALAHPEVPLLVAWPDSYAPQHLQTLLDRVPSAVRAARDPAELIEQVRDLVGPPYGNPAAAGHSLQA